MKPSILKNTILKLFHKGYSKNLSALIDRIHPADLALVFPSIQDKERKTLFDQIIDDEHAAKILTEITDRKLVAKILNGLNHKRICDVFHYMEPDDAADILGFLPTKDSEAILRLMQKDDATEVNKLLKYEPDTAGGIMTPGFVAVLGDNDVEEIRRKLRKIKGIELIIYIYTVDKESRLLGRVPVSDILIAPDDTKISKITDKNIFYVKSRVPRDEVLRIVNKYHLIEIPVVNKDRQILGIITADDVMDVMKNETTEKLLINSGARHIDDQARASVWKYFKARFCWSLFCFIGGIAAAAAIQGIVPTNIAQLSYLTMLPLVVIMSVISSSQTAASVARSIFIGKLDGEPKIKVLYKEIKLSIVMGILFGAIAGGFDYLYNQHLRMACVIAAGIFILFPVSAYIGFIMPVLMTKIRRIPSNATMPFTATVSFLLNVCIYLLMSTNLLALVIIRRI